MKLFIKLQEKTMIRFLLFSAEREEATAQKMSWTRVLGWTCHWIKSFPTTTTSKDYHFNVSRKTFLLFLFPTHPIDRKSSSVSGTGCGDQDMNARSLSRSSLGSVSSDVMDSLPPSSTSSEHQSQPQFPIPSKHSLTPSSMSASVFTTHQVQFSSADHIPLAFRSMNQMRKSGLLCDVHLVAGKGGDQIKCHKVVLAATSAYFNAMFSSEYN